MKKPRRRENYPGLHDFFWTEVPNGYGGSPRVRLENVVRGDRFHRKKRTPDTVAWLSLMKRSPGAEAPGLLSERWLNENQPY